MKNQQIIVYENAKPLENYSVAGTVLRLLSGRETRKASLEFMKVAFHNFFMLQTKQKLKITKIPVVNIDHVLDEQVPFIPKKVKIYLDFVSFFIRIMGMFIKELGVKNGSAYCVRIINYIKQLYLDAATIYRLVLTTTNRPFYIKTPKFLTIHLFDPHLLCVPSLHVSIVSGVWALVRKLFNEEDCKIDEEKKETFLKQIYDGAVRITESVLFVKQHSLNCVGAALYMISATGSVGFFTAPDAEKFITSLFESSKEIAENECLTIKKYIYSLYCYLEKNRLSSENWRQPLFDFINNYSN